MKQLSADKEQFLRPDDPKLVGGIYFNPVSIKEINKELDGTGSFNVASSMFKIKTTKDEFVKKEDEKQDDQNDEDME